MSESSSNRRPQTEVEDSREDEETTGDEESEESPERSPRKNLDFPLSRIVGRFSDEFDVDVISVTGRGIRIDTFQKGDPKYKVELELDDPIVAMKLLVAPNTLRTLVAVQQSGTILFIPCTHGTGGDFLHAAYDYSNCTDENIRPLVTGRTLDRPLIAVDPIDKTVLIIAYPGVITFCKWSKKRWQECDFTHVTHEERDVIDIDIVQKTANMTEVVYLVRRKGTLGSPEVIHVYQASYDATEKSFEVLKRIECGGNYKLVYAMPFPTKGYLLVATTKIVFRPLEGKRGPTIHPEDIMFKTQYKFNGILDRSRALFVDLNDRVVIVKLKFNEDNLIVTSGKVEFVKHNEDIMFLSIVYKTRLVVQSVKHQPQYAELIEMEEGRSAIHKEDGSKKPRNPPHQPFQVGQTIKDRFTLIEEMGSGLFGTVYKVTDNADKKSNYVLKAIAPDDEATYHKECSALGLCFSVPGVIDLHYAFELNRNFCLVMPYAGESINLLLERSDKHKFSMSNSIRIGFSVMKTLAGVHHCGFIHRDISCGNVLINFKNETRPVIKIINFGVSSPFLNEIGERIPVAGSAQFRGREDSELDDVMAVFRLIHTMLHLDPIPMLDIAEDKEPELDFSKVKFPKDCAWLEHFYGYIQHQRKTGYDPNSILKCFNPRNTRNHVDPKSPITWAAVQITENQLAGKQLRRTFTSRKVYSIL